MVATVFRIEIEPINEHVTADELLKKLRLMAGGCGLRVVSADPECESKVTANTSTSVCGDDQHDSGEGPKGIHRKSLGCIGNTKGTSQQ